MKKLLFPILVILMMTAGCTGIPGVMNQLPTAYIDSISPTDASVGETVAFDGHGTDPDGTVVAYRWRSDVDGNLSTRASFDTSSLSAGEHTIYLKVQDNNGAWSEEVRNRFTVSGGVAGAPVINSFDASPGSITLGGSSTLSWNVFGATTISIDKGIGSVALTGTRAISPSMTTTYILTATNAAGSVTATTQVIVSGAPPPGLPVISSFIPNPPTITAGDSSTLSWSVSNATTVTIDQGVGAVAPVGSAPVSPAATTSYTLTATNAAGWSSATTVVLVMAAPPGDLPVINSFTANPENITAGASSTLSWSVSNADTLTLTGEITKTLMSMVGSSVVSPAATITYTLAATNAAGSVTATAQVVVATEHTVTLALVSGETGSVYKDELVSNYMLAGDTNADTSIRTYFSFDLTSLAGVDVTSAKLTFTKDGVVRTPWPDLVKLWIGRVDYGPHPLQLADYNLPGTAFHSFNVEPAAIEEIDVTSGVQSAVGAADARFQVRTHFAMATDNDHLADYIRFSNATLTVTYLE